MSDVASPSFSAETMPRKPPSSTMAILMYNSGRMASCIQAARAGKKLPTMRPRISAMTKPPSEVSRSDQLTPNFCISAGVFTAKLA